MAERRITTGGRQDLRGLRDVVNGLIAQYELVLQKLDADAGVTDTDYSSLHGGVDTLA